jgi:DNA polymerase-3 subunit epsilon
MRFIAFDLETTGTVAGIDAICEIGAVRFIDGQVDSLFCTLIDPQKPIPPGATRVNGITDDMVQGKPLIENVLSQFADFCGDDILVAHNAPFDSQFLISDIKKHETPAPRGIVLDSLPISRKVLPHLPNHKLGTIVQHLKIPSVEFHRAEADATYLGHMFNLLLKRISVGGQPPKIESLIALTGKPEFRFPQIVRQPKQLDLLGLF